MADDAFDKARKKNNAHPDVCTPGTLRSQAVRTIERLEDFLTNPIPADLRPALVDRAYDMLSILVFRRRERAEAAYEELTDTDWLPSTV